MARRRLSRQDAAWRLFVDASDDTEIIDAATGVLKEAGEVGSDVRAPAPEVLAEALFEKQISPKWIRSARERLNEMPAPSIGRGRPDSVSAAFKKDRAALVAVWQRQDEPANEYCEPLPSLHTRWRALKTRPSHPLFPILLGYFLPVREVSVTLSRSCGYLPSIGGGKPAPEREAGLRLAGLLDDHESARLPAMPADDRSPTPLLDIVDSVTGKPLFASHRGRGVPLEIRLIHGAMLAVDNADRHGVARFAVTIKDLRNILFPGDSGWQRYRDWPRMRGVLLGIHKAGIVLPHTRQVWLPLTLRSFPMDTASLNDVIVMDLSFPPGATGGPKVDAKLLRRLSFQSRAQYAAYVGVNAIQWQPGVTRVPPPVKTKGKRFFAWVGIRSRYRLLKRTERRQLLYGTGDSRHRTKPDQPFEDLAKAGHLTIFDRNASHAETCEPAWLIVPNEAAKAIRKKERSAPSQ